MYVHTWFVAKSVASDSTIHTSSNQSHQILIYQVTGFLDCWAYVSLIAICCRCDALSSKHWDRDETGGLNGLYSLVPVFKDQGSQPVELEFYHDLPRHENARRLTLILCVSTIVFVYTRTGAHDGLLTRMILCVKAMKLASVFNHTPN